MARVGWNSLHGFPDSHRVHSSQRPRPALRDESDEEPAVEATELTGVKRLVLRDESDGAEEDQPQPQPTAAGAFSPDEAFSDPGGSRKRRADLPAIPRKRKRGSKKLALAILADPRRMKEAVRRLKEDFFAASGAPSISSKRATVEDFAKTAMGLPLSASSEEIYPLTITVVEAVSAALKDAFYRGADQYLGELRLGHIEADEEIGPALGRTFAKCKRSVLRGLGPSKKAAELQLSEMRMDAGPTPDDPKALADPVSCYICAEGYLLREIEVANMEVGHLTPDHEQFAGVLLDAAGDAPRFGWKEDEPGSGLIMEARLPVSKTDVRGMGASRRLRCCCHEVGQSDKCAAHVLLRHRSKRIRELGGNPEVDPEDSHILEALSSLTSAAGPPTSGRSSKDGNGLYRKEERRCPATAADAAEPSAGRARVGP